MKNVEKKKQKKTHQFEDTDDIEEQKFGNKKDKKKRQFDEEGDLGEDYDQRNKKAENKKKKDHGLNIDED